MAYVLVMQARVISHLLDDLLPENLYPQIPSLAPEAAVSPPYHGRCVERTRSPIDSFHRMAVAIPCFWTNHPFAPHGAVFAWPDQSFLQTSYLMLHLSCILSSPTEARRVRKLLTLFHDVIVGVITKSRSWLQSWTRL